MSKTTTTDRPTYDCPAWCDLEHPSATDDGGTVVHLSAARDVPIASGDGSSGRVRVQVYSTVAVDAAFADLAEAPGVYLDDKQLTPGEAELLASALMAAAARAEQ